MCLFGRLCVWLVVGSFVCGISLSVVCVGSFLPRKHPSCTARGGSLLAGLNRTHAEQSDLDYFAA